MTQQVVANTSSPWSSKTNWVLALTMLADTLNELLPLVPVQYQHTVSVSITLIGLVLGIVTKTFFTTTISSASVPSIAPVSAVSHDDGEAQTETEALNITQVALAKAADK
jgi:hypothetical protein